MQEIKLFDSVIEQLQAHMTSYQWPISKDIVYIDRCKQTTSATCHMHVKILSTWTYCTFAKREKIPILLTYISLRHLFWQQGQHTYSSRALHDKNVRKYISIPESQLLQTAAMTAKLHPGLFGLCARKTLVNTWACQSFPVFVW